MSEAAQFITFSDDGGAIVGAIRADQIIGFVGSGQSSTEVSLGTGETLTMPIPVARFKSRLLAALPNSN